MENLEVKTIIGRNESLWGEAREGWVEEGAPSQELPLAKKS